MAKIPEKKHTLASIIDKAHEEKPQYPRGHMGCSQLGHYCDRWLWLSFRFAVQEKFSGRMLRLFRRGQLEEETIEQDLRSIGCDIVTKDEKGKQLRVKFGCHISGSMDGVIRSGLPEAPKKSHVVEMKTHSKKSFDDLVKNGVQKSKPQHYAQMQLYMLGTEIDRALYYSVCKDNDEIYTERVKFNKEEAQLILQKGKHIVLSDRLPEPISADPSWYQCKFCAAYSFCHETHLTKEINCRTCAHVTPLEDGTWHCGRYDASGIPLEYQIKGCECHVLHPDLVPWQRKESDNPYEAIYLIDGKEIRNGEPCKNCYSSKEIITSLGAVKGDCPEATMARNIFEGTFTGHEEAPPF